MGSRKRVDAPMQSLQQCANCNFFLQRQGNRGECRRYPPTTTPDGNYRRYPIVCQDDWCGEWVKAN